MSFTIKITNGKTEADFLSTSYKLEEGGLRIPATRYKALSSAPLVGSHGNSYSNIEYQNRKLNLNFSVYGSTYPTLMGNLNTISKLINEANQGECVDLVLQAQDSNTSYLKILSASLKMPDQMFSLEGVHWKEDGNYVLHGCGLDLETAPFFTDYPSYESESDVTRAVDTTIDNGDALSFTDIAGDITTETILEFVGAYSNGTEKIYIGTGMFSLETNLTAAINDTVTSMAVDEDYQGKLLVPFSVTIDSEQLEVTNIEDGTWTVVRGYNSTTPASHSLGATVTLDTRYDLDADSSLSYCDTSGMRTGVIDDISLVGGGSGYTVNQIVTLSGDGNGDAKIRVLSVSSGAIVTWEITDGGSGYTAADTGVTCTPAGATFDVDAIVNVAEAGGAATVSIGAAGTGYSVSDVLTLTGGNSDCTVTVSTVGTGGDVTGISLTTAGTEYVVQDAYATTAAPTGGSGCTIDIDTIATNVSTTDDLGSNYMTVKVSGQGEHDLIEWDLDRHYVSVINQRCRIIGKEAQSGSGWNTSLNYRVKVGYRTDNDDSFIELDKTDWKTPVSSTNALFDFGSVMIPPSGSVESAPELAIILQVQIKPDDVYDSILDIIEYSLDIDFIKLIPVGYGFRFINCGSVPFFINDKLIDDSRKIAPYVQEYSTAFLGEVTVDGIMPPVRLIPTNAGNSLHFLFEDGGGTASMAMDLDVEVAVIGNYLGLVD